MKASEFKKLLMTSFEQFADLMVSKNLDYGPEAIGNSGFEGILTRAGDKLGRLKGLHEKSQSLGGVERPNNESILDTCMDLSNYGMIAWLYWQCLWPKETLVDDRGEYPTMVPQDPAVVKRSPMVYLAGPIDAKASGSTEFDVREGLAVCLREHDIITFDPRFPYKGPDDASKWDAVIDGNMAMLTCCDALIACLPSNVSTVGTVCEILHALALGKPVVVMSAVKYVYFGAMVTYAETVGEAVKQVLTCLQKNTH